jgi:hypothetical protein
VFAVAMSPDRRMLAWGGESKVIHVWDIVRGQMAYQLEGQNAHVRALTFSSDSRRLAGCGFGNRVEAWDMTDGRLLFSRAGHANTVEGVAFDHSAERLVSTCRDGTVKIWDVLAGEEILTLGDDVTHEKDSIYRAVCFLPAGGQLAGTGNDWSIRVWDAGCETQILRDAFSLVQFLYGQGLVEAQVREKLAADVTVREEVRERALAIAGSYGASLLESKASRLVKSLFAEALLRREVLNTIQADQGLSEVVRSRALALAKIHPENTQALWNASWFVVRQPDPDPEQVKRALFQAEAAYRLAPDRGPMALALGAAYFRASRYEDSLKLLTTAEHLCAANADSSHPSALAFLVMVHHRLGQKQSVQATLAQLLEAMKRSDAKNEGANGALLREALAEIKENRAGPG